MISVFSRLNKLIFFSLKKERVEESNEQEYQESRGINRFSCSPALRSY